MGREAGVCSPLQPRGVSGILWMNPKQISAGLTCLSAELSPTGKAAWVAPARAASGYTLVLSYRPCPSSGQATCQGAGGP